MTLAVETKQLSKIYKGKVRALQEVDLAVPKGSAFGLLGPNGAGKSTLVKCLLSIVRPTSGVASLLGRDISLAESRRGVGYLPEGHRFPRYLTGRGVCEYFGKLSGLKGEELQKEVDEKLEFVGMKQWAETKISKYSKGMNQRVGLAQAMLGKPEVIFLDEPTDGVDPVGRQQIREVIKQLVEGGTTIFLNSHLLLEVEQICDHVAIMHHGQVLQQGTIDEIREAVGRKRPVIKFTTSGDIDKETRAKLKEIGKARGLKDGGEVFDMKLESKERISDVLDVLRAANISVYGVEPERANLEDAFINLIGKQEDQSVGGVHDE